MISREPRQLRLVGRRPVGGLLGGGSGSGAGFHDCGFFDCRRLCARRQRGSSRRAPSPRAMRSGGAASRGAPEDFGGLREDAAEVGRGREVAEVVRIDPAHLACFRPCRRLAGDPRADEGRDDEMMSNPPCSSRSTRWTWRLKPTIRASTPTSSINSRSAACSRFRPPRPGRPARTRRRLDSGPRRDQRLAIPEDGDGSRQQRIGGIGARVGGEDRRSGRRRRSHCRWRRHGLAFRPQWDGWL